MGEPILAPSDTWFTKGNSGILRSSLTEIEIVDTYTPTGSETASWDASEVNDGSVMVYVEGTKLTIAGNKSGKVFANPDASYMFADQARADYYLNLTKIEGIGLLDTSKVTNMYCMFRSIVKVTGLDLNHFDTSNVVNMGYMFGSSSTQGNMSLKTLNISNWNTPKLNNIRTMFQNCVALTSLDLGSWDVSKVTDCSYMFNNCLKLTTIGDISKWDIVEVTLTKLMFQNCTALQEVNMTNCNFSKVTEMTNMFYNCSSLVSLGDTSKWNTGSCTNMYSMFGRCTSLKQLDVSNWDVSKVTTFNSMFCGGNYGIPPFISSLDVSKWDTSSATDMGYMFHGYLGSEVLDVSNFNVSKVTNFQLMFASSGATIVGTENWDTSKATNMYAMFYGVKNTRLDVSNLNTSKISSFGRMFYNCSELTEIIGLEKLDTSSSIDFSDMFSGCSKLKELNLSNFDTTKAKVGGSVASNGSTAECTKDMFTGMTSLQKITLGPKFTFQGDGTADPSYHGTLPETADGFWYKRDRSAYAYNEIPNNTAATYYSGLDVVEELFYKKMLVKNGTLLDIADAVRAATGETNGLKLGDMPEKIGEVFEAGAQAGRKSEYDEFWDALQSNGERRNYWGAFCSWDDSIFKPKYPIIAKANKSMFYLSTITFCPSLDLTLASNVENIFDYASKIITIEKIVLKKDGSQGFYKGFASCKSLVNLTFEGVIGKTLSIGESPLSKDSILNILSVLSSDSTSQTLTLSLSAVNNAFETSPGAADGSTSEEWLALANTKPNWTVSLV